MRFQRCCFFTSPHLTSPHLTSPHLASPRLTSPQVLDSNNSLLYFVMRPVTRAMKASDFSLLQSWKKDEQDGYLVASRSVITDELPPTPGLRRGAVLPSGFLLEAVDAVTHLPVPPGSAGASTRLTYVVQMAPLKGVTGAFQETFLAVASKLMVRRFVRLQAMLKGHSMPNAKPSIFDSGRRAATNAQIPVVVAQPQAHQELV